MKFAIGWLALNIFGATIGYAVTIAFYTNDDEIVVWNIPVFPIVLLPLLAINGLMTAIFFLGGEDVTDGTDNNSSVN